MRPGFPERGSFGDRFSEIERRLQALESANRLTSASIGSGGLTIKDGGQLTAGPTTMDASGVQVGDDVVVDSTGLKVGGVLQETNWIDEQFQFESNPTLTTTETALATVTVTPPAGVDTLTVIAFGGAHLSQETTADNRIKAFIRIDGVDSPNYLQGGPGTSIGVNTNNNQAVPAVFSRTLTTVPASFDVVLRVQVFDDSPSVGGSAGLTVLSIGRLA